MRIQVQATTDPRFVGATRVFQGDGKRAFVRIQFRDAVTFFYSKNVNDLRNLDPVGNATGGVSITGPKTEDFPFFEGNGEIWVSSAAAASVEVQWWHI